MMRVPPRLAWPNWRRSGLRWAIAAIAMSVLMSAEAQPRPTWKADVEFLPELGAPLPLDLEFVDHQSQRVALRDYFDTGRPVILVPVYYRCPMLCGLELNALVRCLRGMSLAPPDDFQIVTFSIDPREGSQLAAQKRAAYLRQYERPQAEPGWHFLTGSQAEIDRLCRDIHFRVTYDESTRQFAHAAGLIVCTPDGRIARFHPGIDYAPRDLRFSLVEASQGNIGTVVDQLQLYCYLYDPTTGKYGVAILALVRAAGGLTLAALIVAVGWMLCIERQRQLVLGGRRPARG